MTTRESTTVESGNGINLDVRSYKPAPKHEDSTANDQKIVVVLVHPYSVLGGCQGLMKGIARNLADEGITAVTFDMRGVGKSTGRPSLTGFSEVSDVVAICKWASQNLASNRILLVGSSAGAPIAGSAVDQVDEVVGYVSLGYPFGLTASILFGRHHKAILQSPKPKLFVMGTKDGFTSVKQLANKVKTAAGRAETHLIEGVSHFQMEGPAYDTEMAKLIISIKTESEERMPHKERGYPVEASGEASSIGKKASVSVEDTEKIESLTAEVENLKGLLESERQRADECEKKYAEALESSEIKWLKLEETERRVLQLQEALNS